LRPVYLRDEGDDLVDDVSFAHDECCGERVDGGGAPAISVPDIVLDIVERTEDNERYRELLNPFVTGFNSSFGNAY
jgi:hypothetical protein